MSRQYSIKILKINFLKEQINSLIQYKILNGESIIIINNKSIYKKVNNPIFSLKSYKLKELEIILNDLKDAYRKNVRYQLYKNDSIELNGNLF